MIISIVKKCIKKFSKLFGSRNGFKIRSIVLLKISINNSKQKLIQKRVFQNFRIKSIQVQFFRDFRNIYNTVYYC